jgi:hypothetical protein
MKGVHPLWGKAPFVLLRFPPLFVAVATGALLLALAASSSSLFVSSTVSAALEDELADTTEYGAGMAVIQGVEGAVPGVPTVADRVAATRRAVFPVLSDVPYVGEPVLTVLAATVSPVSASGAHTARPVRLLAKTNALRHVTKLAGADGAGVWIADEVAQAMELQPDDTLRVRSDAGRTLRVPIDGIYRALWKEEPTPYWRSLSQDIYPRSPELGPPPTFLIADERLAFQLSEQLGDHSFLLRWEWPLATRRLTLPEAERVKLAFDRFERALEEPASRIGAAFRCAGCPERPGAGDIASSSLLSAVIGSANQTVTRIRGPADLLAGAGMLAAVTVLAAAGAFVVARRRAEAALLHARGASPISIGARTAVESLLPAALGTAAGLVFAYVLVGLGGPGVIAPNAVAEAAKAAVAVLLIGAALIGFVAGVAFRTRDPKPSLPVRLGSIPWELVVLAAAVYSFYDLKTRGAFVEGTAEVARARLSVLVFPILFMAAIAGLAARMLRMPLRGLRARGGGSASAPFLAVRRLAGAERFGVLFMTASALALGLYVYTETIVRSLDATVHAKSLLFVGSDVHGITISDARLPSTFPYPVTTVTKIRDRARVGGIDVDVMAVDSASLPRVAHWDESWSDVPLDELAKRLDADRGARLPVILAGQGAPALDALAISGSSIPIAVVGTATAFPGMSLQDPLVVVDRRSLKVMAEASGVRDPVAQGGTETQIWAAGDTRPVARALAASPLRPFPIVTAEEIRKNPAIRSLTQTFSYLEALGVGAALLAVVGTILYLQLRQRSRVVSQALASRMGLSMRRHRSALALELGALLLGGLGIGAVLAIIVARIVIVELDAPAELPSGPLFRTPWLLLAIALAALVAASLLGALLADRSARRASLVEVLRAEE